MSWVEGRSYNLAMPGEEPARDVSSIALGGADLGARLDRFLVDALGVSRSQARALLARGAVSLGGRTLGFADKGLSLPGEGVLEVEPFRRPADQRALAAHEVRVLTSGPGWLVVDKPAGWPVHPLSEDETGALSLITWQTFSWDTDLADGETEPADEDDLTPVPTAA